MRNNEEEAQELVDKAMTFIKQKDYAEAKALLKKANNLYPKLENLLEMSIVCDTLFYGDFNFPTCGIDWYSILHLHPLASDVEVKLQTQMLISCTKLMDLESFPRASDALRLLKQAKFVLCNQPSRVEFDTKRGVSGLVDNVMPVSTKTHVFEEKYLNWKPPLLRSHVYDGGKSGHGENSENREDREKRSTSPPPFELCLFPELKKLKNQIFDEMPQNPHFSPISMYSKKLQEGMIMGVDSVFIKLCEEIRKLEDPQSLWDNLDEFTQQMKELENMGYDVDKLRERVEELKTIAEHVRVARGAIEKYKVEVDEHEMVIVKHAARLLELKAEIARSKVLVDGCSSKIENLKKKKVEIAHEFVSEAMSGWK